MSGVGTANAIAANIKLLLLNFVRTKRKTMVKMLDINPKNLVTDVLFSAFNKGDRLAKTK